MSAVRAAATVALDPPRALALWTDIGRWASFMEGFAHVLEGSPEWPAPGARLVWQSIPGGRGRVTERVVESEPGRFTTQLYEDAYGGRQELLVAPLVEGGSRVRLTLEYELARRGPLRALADAVFIRRAQSEALRRTLRRFAVEAEEEAGLR